MTDDTLQRFYHALVEALRERSPADIEGPFTVAEIYQDLVPYRTHRDQLGVEMNGDYEHALLRLLAGEGGYLRLESEHALRDIRSELEEMDPNTTVYRDYAAVDVRIDPFVLRSGGPEGAAPGDAGMDEGDAGADEEAEVELVVEEPESEAPAASGAESAFFSGAAPSVKEPEPEDDSEPEVEPELQVEEVAEISEPEPVAKPVMAAQAATPPIPGMAANGAAEGDCQWCGSELPEGFTILFCPFCGQDMSMVPCASCGTALKPDWQFCISCGDAVAS